MRSADQWFELYGESHKNAINKAIHWVCIPLIVLSTLGLFQSIPHPFGTGVAFHWGTVLVLGAMVFYLRLSWTLAAGMAVVAGACLAINAALAEAGVNVLISSVAIFAGAWLFQFIGHKIEGQKPSFFQDLQFLLVGPAWLLQFVYRKVGIPVTSAEAAPAAR